MNKKSMGLILVLFLVPIVIKDGYWLRMINLAGLYAILSLGLCIPFGFAALIHLGFAAIAGIAAYTFVLLFMRQGINFLIAGTIGILMAAIINVLIGIPALRLRENYIAVVTIGFHFIFYLLMVNWESLTGGPDGIILEDISVFGKSLSKPIQLGNMSLPYVVKFYYPTIGMVFYLWYIIRRLPETKFGRSLMTIKVDETLARTFGINVEAYKLIALFTGGLFAGYSGVVRILMEGYINPEYFHFIEALMIVTIVIVGGETSPKGIILAAFGLTIIPELFHALHEYRLLFFGLALILAIYCQYGSFKVLKSKLPTRLSTP